MKQTTKRAACFIYYLRRLNAYIPNDILNFNFIQSYARTSLQPSSKRFLGAYDNESFYLERKY